MTRRAERKCAAAVCLALASYPCTARADRYYVGPANGSWNNTTNWSTSLGGFGGQGVPAAGEFVLLRNNDGLNRNIVLDVTTPVFTRLRIGNSSTGLTTLTQ